MVVQLKNNWKKVWVPFDPVIPVLGSSGSKKPSIWTDTCQRCYWRGPWRRLVGATLEWKLWWHWGTSCFGDVKIHVLASHGGVALRWLTLERGGERPSWEGWVWTAVPGGPIILRSHQHLPTRSQLLHKLISPWFLSICYILGPGY